MLIYNYKKEFLGIDEVDLEILGFSDLADLRAEAADFADLFVKTPGFIHNFKHVHWIDYITCNDIGVESKAIINIKGKIYSTILDIKPIYLVDNPSKKAFIVNLIKVRALSASQCEKIASDILEKPSPQTATGSSELFTAPGSIIHSKEDAHIQEDIGEITYDPYAASDANTNFNAVEDIYENTPTINDTKTSHEAPIDINFEDSAIDDSYISGTPTKISSEEPKYQKKVIEEENEDIDDSADYVYDPHLASDELGLPIDLVEEFIQDFISQAESFKDDLYEHIETNNISNLKIQSHKLKGVAANLRVEAALDTLTIINTSDNMDEIVMNLNKFYKVIAKLSNKSNRTNKAISTVNDSDESDDFILSLKDDDVNTTEANTTTNDEVLKTTIDETKEDKSSEIVTQEITEDEITKINIIQDYDKESIANDMGLNITSFNESFDEYISESKKLVSSIVSAYKDDDLDKCKNIAIQIKGMSDNMRMHELDNELNTIMNSTDINELAELLDNIISKLNKFSNSES
ncbi:MAG: Hpt domain-containing protein [Sulfurimonas sp.]|nr:Hpt domain-containing protein [Sulfurimonas sp.]